MTGKPLDTIAWSILAAAGLAVLWLLTRNIMAIPLHVPLDPNEGWNAAHALAPRLYPPPKSLMVNNYPPLSFALIRVFMRLGADPLIAGRWISIAAFLATGAGLALVLRRMDCGPRAIACAVLFFAAVLLIDSDYIGINDPQLLGHAIQIAALLLLLREQPVIAALLFAVSLFIKHNLLAMPLAAAVWLTLLDRRTGLAFGLWGMAFVLAGLVGFQFTFGIGLLDQLASPRLWSLANLAGGAGHLWWVVLPAAAMIGLWPDRTSLFCAVYGVMALLLGLAASAGDGVDSNAFFDLAIALSLGLGVAMDRGRWPILGAAATLPLLMCLAWRFDDNNFFFTKRFAAQSARDIAFLKSRPGPAVCDQLSLCLWAGKPAEVDVFNIGEQFKTGTRDPGPLIRMIAGHHFAVLQLQDVGPLGPAIRSAIAKNYRADHSNDNGTFLTPVF